MSELINLYKDVAATQQVFPRTQIEAIEGLYELIRKARPVNLLDNSDFRNPVNQRGASSYTLDAWGGYTIDRWAAYASGCTVTASNDGIQLNGDLYQPISKETARRYNGKTVTIAAKIGGNVYCAHGVVNQKGAYNVTASVDTPYGKLLLTCEDTDMLFFILDTDTSIVVEWAALYEGEYTADTLPEYQPKGYSAELLECKRYYLKGVFPATIGTTYGGGSIFTIVVDKMRVNNPTYTINQITSQGWGNVYASNYVAGWGETVGSKYYVNFTYSSSTADVGKTVAVCMEFFADL